MTEPAASYSLLETSKLLPDVHHIKSVTKITLPVPWQPWKSTRNFPSWTGKTTQFMAWSSCHCPYTPLYMPCCPAGWQLWVDLPSLGRAVGLWLLPGMSWGPQAAPGWAQPVWSHIRAHQGMKQLPWGEEKNQANL